MIDLLLKADARIDMRTKQGKTALELMPQYKRNDLIAASKAGGRQNSPANR